MSNNFLGSERSSFPLSPSRRVFFFFPFFLFHQGNCEVNFCLSPPPPAAAAGGNCSRVKKGNFPPLLFFSSEGGKRAVGRPKEIVQLPQTSVSRSGFLFLFRKLIKTIFLLSAFPGGGGRAGVVEMEYYCFFNSETQGRKKGSPAAIPQRKKGSKFKFSFLILAFYKGNCCPCSGEKNIWTFA